jgi:putative endonuclease
MKRERWHLLCSDVRDVADTLRRECASTWARLREERAAFPQTLSRWRVRLRVWWLASPQRPFRDDMARDTEELGALGERIAMRWLAQQRITVLELNFQNVPGGEIDLVCRDGSTITFVEVKTRRTELHHRPAEAVNLHKQRLIIRAAHAWRRKHSTTALTYRFDIVEVLLRVGEPPEVRLIANAFQEHVRRL